MEALFEHVASSPRSAWNYHVREAPTFDLRWHYHEECELTLITRGRGVRFVGDSIESYEAADLVFYGPGLPHTYASDEGIEGGHEAICAQFRLDFLGPGLFAGPDLVEIGRLIERARRGLAFPRSVGQSAEAPMRQMGSQVGADRTITLLSLLSSLSVDDRVRPLASDRYWPTIDDSERSRIDAVCALLASSYSRQVRLLEVAEVAQMSPKTVSRFFRNVMGRSITAYLIELRIGCACRLLIDTDASISAIAVNCGYTNLANFNRQFHKLKGMTPSAFRRQFKAIDPALRPEPRNRLLRVT